MLRVIVRKRIEASLRLAFIEYPESPAELYG